MIGSATRHAAILSGVAALALAPGPAQARWAMTHVPIKRTALRAITISDASTVWVAGSGGLCFRSGDAGKSWRELCHNAMAGLDLRGIAVLGRKTAVIMSGSAQSGGQAMLFRTSDDGKSWSKVFDDRSRGAFLDGFAFWDDRNGIALGDPVGGQWYLLVTSDGGRHWRRRRPLSIPPLAPTETFLGASNSVLIVDGAAKVWVGSAGGRQSRVFFSTDRGLHWRASALPRSPGRIVNLIGLANLGGGRMAAIGGDYQTPAAGTANAFLSHDGGMTWTGTDARLARGLREAVGSPGGRILLSVGTPGSAISADAGRSWRSLGIAGLHAIACREKQCWAAGNDGVVAHWVAETVQ